MTQALSSDFSTALAKSSFKYFCKLILNQPLGDFHEDWIAAIDSPARKHLCIMAPRGHFKTSILSVAFPLWVMYRTPSSEQKVFMLISATQKKASEVLTLIKDRIAGIPALMEVLLPENIHETKWSESQIRTRNNHRVFALGIGDQVRGYHVDYCISDDLLSAEESTNTEYIKSCFYGIVFPITQARSGKHIVVGTPTSFDDLLFELQGKSTFDWRRYSAVSLDEEGNWLEPLFPERFSLEKLREIKETQPARFWSREYMCEPMGDESSIFPSALLQKSETAFNSLQWVADKRYQRFIGGDLAMSDSERADFTVFTVLERRDDGVLALVDFWRRRGCSTSEIKQAVRELVTAHAPSCVCIEQQGLSYGVVKDLREEFGFLVREFDTTRKSKEQAISRIEVLLRGNPCKLALPRNEILFSEMSAMGYKKAKDGRQTFISAARHDDSVLSLAFAVSAAEGGGIASLSYI